MMQDLVEQQCRWHPVQNLPAMARVASVRILAAADHAVRTRGTFHLVLAGGNTPRGTYRVLRDAAVDWSGWNIYFGDERCLLPDDAERNSRMAAQCWLDHVAIPASQRHPIPAELGPDEAAARYAETLRSVGEFDVVLLGLGEDGHTASLFPGHAWGEAPGSAPVLGVYDAPKPPPQRVSLSASRLSNAREVIFLVAGDDKQHAVTQWREGARIPARSIKPVAGVDVIVESTLLPPRN